MGISANSYGSVAGVAAYVKHMTNSSGTFDATTQPTLTEVEGFIDQMSAQLNGWLAAAGYSIPVTNAQAVQILAGYSNLGAAGLCELTQRSGGYKADAQNNRENKFLDLFYKAQALIESGALALLGAGQTEEAGTFFGLSVGGRTRNGQRLRPIFTRTGLGNDPTAERGVKEPGYTGDP